MTAGFHNAAAQHSGIGQVCVHGCIRTTAARLVTENAGPGGLNRCAGADRCTASEREAKEGQRTKFPCGTSNEAASDCGKIPRLRNSLREFESVRVNSVRREDLPCVQYQSVVETPSGVRQLSR